MCKPDLEQLRYLQARVERLELMVLDMWDRKGKAAQLADEIEINLIKKQVRHTHDTKLKERVEWQR